MAENPLDDTIFEERENLMISPNGRTPTLRTAHFLKPSVNSINGQSLKLPSLPLCSESEWPIKVSFNGWHNSPLTKWKTWVYSMHSKYESIWKKSGIYEAIMASTYQIRRIGEVIFGLAERWCSETSTFLFSWAEATITLEDMMILGGFSVVGSPASMPLESKELREIEENLNKVWKSIFKSKPQKGDHYEWLKYFMESGNEMEHEAFLSLWLSRFVFPGNLFDTINRDNFSIAIYLARGIKIALAPTVLATLYRDLSLLKETIVASANLKVDECKENYLALTLWSPLQFVQIWAWERLPPLQPKPNFIHSFEPRLARWHGLNRLKRENVRWVIDSAGDSFLWRPYAIAVDNWSFPKFYKEKEQWVFSGCGLNEEFESFARCLRVSDLVGIDSIEPYLPHRVAMQFGMDQDLPGWIPRVNATPEIAWENYSRPVRDAKLYFPSRLFEADVTTRYLEWWEKSVLDLQGEIKDRVRGKRSLRRRSNADVPLSLPAKCNWGKEMLQTCNKPSIQDRLDVNDKPFLAVEKHCLPSLIEGKYDDVPPGFPQKFDGGKEMVQTCNKRSIQDRRDADDKLFLAAKKHCLSSSTEGNDDDVPPGFPPKCNWGKEMVQTCNKRSIQDKLDVDDKPFLAAKEHCLLSSTEGNDDDVPPGFPPKCNVGEEMVQTCNKGRIQERVADNEYPFLDVKKHCLPSSTEGSDDDVPPGFSPKRNWGKEMVQTCNKRRIQDQVADNEYPFLAVKKHCLPSSTEGNGVPRTKVMNMKPMVMNRQSEAMIRRSETDSEIASSHEIKAGSSIQNLVGISHEEEGSSSFTTKLPDLEIEARISKVERVVAGLKAVVAGLKAARFGCRFVKQEPEISI